MAAAFGLRLKLPDYLVELYKWLKTDLPSFNGDPSWTLPMPAYYVIGPDRHDPLCRRQPRLHAPAGTRGLDPGARTGDGHRCPRSH